MNLWGKCTNYNITERKINVNEGFVFASCRVLARYFFDTLIIGAIFTRYAAFKGHINICIAAFLW